MQIGLTWPLQRQLGKKPRYGEGVPRVFCWDAHCITLHGCSTLLLVHCTSRYVCLHYGMTFADWNALEDVAMQTIKSGIEHAGVPHRQQLRYFEQAGEVLFTRTHGRPEVAYLNVAWRDVLAHDTLLDESSVQQVLLCAVVNDIPCRCAAYPDVDTARRHLCRCFEEME